MFFLTPRLTELIWFNFSKEFFHLVRWIFKIISENFNFCCHLQKFTFFKNLEFQFNYIFMGFYHFLTTLSHFDVLVYTCRYQSLLKENRRLYFATSLNQCCTAVKNVKSLKQTISALIISENSAREGENSSKLALAISRVKKIGYTLERMTKKIVETILYYSVKNFVRWCIWELVCVCFWL